MASSEKVETKENEKKEEVNKNPLPEKVKKKIIDEANRETQPIQKDKVMLMRKKIVEQANSTVISSNDWESLYKMFQVLQVRDNKDRNFDDYTLNILQNMVHTLGMDIAFNEDATLKPIDYKEYEDEEIDMRVVPDLTVEIDPLALGDILVAVDIVENNLSSSLKRVDPKLFSNIINLSGEKIDNINKVDNYISYFVKLLNLDVDIEKEHRVIFENLVEDLNNIVVKETRDIKKFYKKKFIKIEERKNEEEVEMGRIIDGPKRKDRTERATANPVERWGRAKDPKKEDKPTRETRSRDVRDSRPSRDDSRNSDRNRDSRPSDRGSRDNTRSSRDRDTSRDSSRGGRSSRDNDRSRDTSRDSRSSRSTRSSDRNSRGNRDDSRNSDRNSRDRGRDSRDDRRDSRNSRDDRNSRDSNRRGSAREQTKPLDLRYIRLSNDDLYRIADDILRKHDRDLEKIDRDLLRDFEDVKFSIDKREEGSEVKFLAMLSVINNNLDLDRNLEDDINRLLEMRNSMKNKRDSRDGRRNDDRDSRDRGRDSRGRDDRYDSRSSRNDSRNDRSRDNDRYNSRDSRNDSRRDSRDSRYDSRDRYNSRDSRNDNRRDSRDSRRENNYNDNRGGSAMGRLTRDLEGIFRKFDRDIDKARVGRAIDNFVRLVGRVDKIEKRDLEDLISDIDREDRRLADDIKREIEKISGGNGNMDTRRIERLVDDLIRGNKRDLEDARLDRTADDLMRDARDGRLNERDITRFIDDCFRDRNLGNYAKRTLEDLEREVKDSRGGRDSRDRGRDDRRDSRDSRRDSRDDRNSRDRGRNSRDDRRDSRGGGRYNWSEIERRLERRDEDDIIDAIKKSRLRDRDYDDAMAAINRGRVQEVYDIFEKSREEMRDLENVLRGLARISGLSEDYFCDGVQPEIIDNLRDVKDDFRPNDVPYISRDTLDCYYEPSSNSIRVPVVVFGKAESQVDKRLD